MLRMLLNLSIGSKVISLLVLTVVLFSGVILFWFLPMVEEETFSDRKKGLKNIVDVSYALLAEYEQRAGLGAFSREEAQERAMTRIRQMRYGDNDYLWINDDTLPFPKMIMHPTKPELDGRILDDPLFECAASMEFGENGRAQDIPGRDKNLFQAFVEVVARTGDGFVVYDWPRPTRDGVTQELYLKHSYVRLFQPWGWIIGTGVYVDDIAAQTARMRMTVISVTSVVLAAVMLVAVFFIASIQRPMKALRVYAEKVTQGDLDFETSGRFYGETDQLKQAITTMVGRLKQTIRDTEIKSRDAEHAAGELQKSNKRYDQLARQSRTMTWEVDADGLYTHVGDVAVELIGYHPQELVGRMYFYDLHPQEGREVFKTAVMEIFQQRDPVVDLDKAMMHKDGHIVWVSSNGFPEFNSDGILSGYRGSDIDITERKQAEEELRVSEARFKSIIAVSNTGAWEYHRDRDYLWCSPEYFTMLGYDPDEFTMDGSANLSQVWIDLIHNEDREKAAGHFSEYLAGGSVGMYENHFRMKSRDSDWIWIWSRGQTLRDSRGNLTDRTVGTHIDITEAKRIQALIDAKNKELEQIVYVASHDLRSPLVNVDGFSRELDYSLKELTTMLDGGKGMEELEKALRTELPDMKKSIVRIRAGARQMDNLLKGLLKLSRSGRAALQIEDIDMNECIGQLASSLAFTLQETEAELTVEDLPACRGDSVQVMQVFSNLMDNAVKYRDPDRPLKIKIRGAMEADRAVYRVEDNGMGIAENHQEYVFELFHRLEPEKTEGEGLGLTIARQTLSRMYGEIRVESQPGKGSVFIVSMPPAWKNQ